jgi:hypothetical protein
MGGMSGRDTITEEQRAALAKLAAILGDTFYLVGGVEICSRSSVT